MTQPPVKAPIQLHQSARLTVFPKVNPVNTPSPLEQGNLEVCIPERVGFAPFNSVSSKPLAPESKEALSLETQLKNFVQWSLQQSYSSDRPQSERLYLLDLGWKVQKLLWDIRHHANLQPVTQ